MLDEVEPGAMDEWMAFCSLEPDPDQWLRAILKLGLARIATACGLATEPDDLEPWREARCEAAIGPRQAAALVGAAGKRG